MKRLRCLPVLLPRSLCAVPRHLLRCPAGSAWHSTARPLPQALQALSLGPFAHAPFTSLRLDLTRPGTPQPSLPELSAFVRAQLPSWRSAGVNAVWVTLSLPEHSALLGELVGPGLFEVHHARGRTCTIFCWLPPGAPCKVPPYPTTQIGVGGVCVDAAGRFLLIRERHAQPGAWKWPGGNADVGEDIPDCAVREVYEETGVRTRFEGLLALRHMHGGAHGVSDLYFVALLRPLAPAAPAAALDAELAIDPGEIAEGCWMDGSSFASTTKHPLMARLGQEALLVAQQKGWLGARSSSGAAAEAAESSVIRLTNVFSPINRKWTQCYLPSEQPVQAWPEGTEPSSAAAHQPRPAPWERSGELR
jgi:ADP-ribose pyrophosphatase YjhB (NUDIX family)